MPSITISSFQLKAAITHSATRDVRYYLNTVLVESDASGTFLIATDGHRMFVGRLEHRAHPEPLQVIIPTDVVKTALAAKTSTLELRQDAGGIWQLGAVSFTPLDARYPAWRQVVPQGGIDARGEYSPAYVYEAHKALALWSHGSGATRAPNARTAQDTGTTCVVTGASADAFVVIQSLNVKKLGLPVPAFM